MESLALLVLSALVISVSCQYDLNTLNLINATQTMQDLERYGHPAPVLPAPPAPTIPNLYPSLNASEFVHIPSKNQSGPGNSIPVIVRPSNVTRVSIEKFINKTMSAVPSGVCIKEVPTASLVRKNDVLVAGNGSDPSLSRIQVCCDGYQRSAFVFRKCDPICSKGCGSHGLCVAPESCTCYPEYVKNAEGVCVKTCPAGCENGVCDANNKCRCNAGYVPDATGGACFAKCDKSCVNGFCSGPNKCSCNAHHTKDVTDPYRCAPICSPPCQNGLCSGPNMCLCLPGYVKDRSGGRGGNKCVKQ